jgi:hypothetical protein
MPSISNVELFMNHYTRWLSEATKEMESRGYSAKDGWSVHDNGQISRKNTQFRFENRKDFAKVTVTSWEKSPLFIKI